MVNLLNVPPVPFKVDYTSTVQDVVLGLAARFTGEKIFFVHFFCLFEVIVICLL